jgi:hypothetical protein
MNRLLAAALLAVTAALSHAQAPAAGSIAVQVKNDGAGSTTVWLGPGSPPVVQGIAAGGAPALFSLGSAISITEGALVVSPAWSSITSTPTTLSGYGITDALPSSAVSAFGLTLIDDADAAAARTTLGLGTLATQSANIADYLMAATAASTYVSLTGSYADPAWITSLAWSKIGGAPAFLTGNQTITFTGDFTGSGTTSIAATLANSGVTAGSYGQAVLTVDAKGRVTSASTTDLWVGIVTGGGGGLPGTLDMSGNSGTAPAGNVFTFSGTDVDTGEGTATGGAGGGLLSTGGDAYGAGETVYAGGAAGLVYTSGGNATSGGIGAPGGNIYTYDGGGSINTRGTGSIQLGSNGTRTTIEGAAASDWTLKFPAGPGTNGQVLTTNGSGTTSWTTVGGSGTVTSVAVAGTDGLEVDSGSPITGAGTITLGVNASTLKTHLGLGNVENTALSTWAGSANLTTLGTITSGTWQGTNIDWSRVSKTGSSLADLATRSAGDLNSGTLPAARLPAPTTTTLGGVQRNTGSGGQFVSGIDSGGALTYGTPAGAAVEIGLACSDETSDLTTGTAKVTFRMPHAMTLTAVRASVTTASTGSTVIVNIKEGGTTVLGTKLSIDASERTSTTAASAATITDSALADDAEMTIDIDQVGSSTPGAGLKVWLIGTRN